MSPRFLVTTRTALSLIFVFSMTSAASSALGTQPTTPNCNPPANPSAPGGDAPAINPDAPHAFILAPQAQGQPCDGESCPPPCPDQTTQQGNNPHPYRPPDHDGGGGDWIAPVAVGGAIALILGGIKQNYENQDRSAGGKNWATPDDLDANGPHFPSRPVLGGFQVQGYAMGGWPFAVDIETQPGTWTWLELRYNDGSPPVQINLSRPEGGRRTQLITLPGDSSSLHIARYSLHSALFPRDRKPIDMAMNVYGIGAGPNAVGSVEQSSAIGSRPVAVRADLSWTGSRDELRSLFRLAAAQDTSEPIYLAVTAFGATPTNPPARMNWTVVARRQFPFSRVEVLQYPHDGKGKYKSVAYTDPNLFERPQASGIWQKVGAGTYALQVRAWRTASGGGDWTGAYAPNYVVIR